MCTLGPWKEAPALVGMAVRTALFFLCTVYVPQGLVDQPRKLQFRVNNCLSFITTTFASTFQVKYLPGKRY
jgi:hypothetical protein